MSPLIKLCVTTPDSLASSSSSRLGKDAADPDAINEAQVLADEFFRCPLLRIDGNIVCMSSRLLFNRLHRSLHYLVAEPYLGNVERIKEVRAECGSLFERYILWLLKQFLPTQNVQIFHSFRIKPAEKGTEPPERDIAVIAGNNAVVFEIKAAIPTLAHRRRAAVADLVHLLGEAVGQAASSADALIQGNAFTDTTLTNPLPQVQSAVPCVVFFEPSPLRYPIARSLEDAISAELKTRPFEHESGRSPVQFFDVEGVEGFGDLFGLPSEWQELLSAIATRSSAPHLRYKPLVRLTGTTPKGDHSGSSAMPRLVVEAEKYSSKRWRELTSQPASADSKDEQA